MFNGLALIAAAILPLDAGVIPDRCDRIHVNRFMEWNNKNGEWELRFEQVMFEDWSDEHETYICRAWRLVKSPWQIPQQDWARRIGDEEPGWYAVWHDGAVLRDVRAPLRSMSESTYDAELLNREIVPKEQRRELSGLGLDPPSGAIRPPAPEARP